MSVDPIGAFDPDRNREIRKAVFGKAVNASRNPEQRAGLNASSSNQYGLVGFYRTEADRKPPSRVLTAELLGDPRPDRFERSEAIRARLGMKAQVTGSIPDKIIPTLRAIEDWPLAPGELADVLGLAQSTCDERVKIAVGLGLAVRTGAGRNRRIALTDEGRAALGALPQ